MSAGFNQMDYESESFNASAQIKSSRKNRRKIKKIIHNCCVYKQKEDGSHEIILKQFLVSCRLKTPKCLTKKAKEIQISKDNEVGKELMAQIKRLSVQKQSKQTKQEKNLSAYEGLTPQKVGDGGMQSLEMEPPMVAFFYFLPTNPTFPMI